MTASDQLKVVATAANEAEGGLIVGRLAGAGITAIEQRASGNAELGGTGARYIYVQASDLERARELLDADEPPLSDEELTRLSEEAAEEAQE
jgi:hypothetical protein